MKKLFWTVLLLVILIGIYQIATKIKILPGDEKTTFQTNMTTTKEIIPPRPFEDFLPLDTGAYLAPKIATKEGTGGLVAGLNAPSDGPYNRTEIEENGQKLKVATITGYIYSYTYNDMGLKITTTPLYPPYFFEKQSESFFKRNGNMIYSINSNERMAEYIQLFHKNSKVSFYNEIKENHMLSGCQIELLTGVDYHFLGKKDLVSTRFSDVASQENTCTEDKEFPANESFITFIFDPKHPEYYYKISFGDGCAPGPCTIFGNIEFF